jgi:hypothetical protein
MPDEQPITAPDVPAHSAAALETPHTAAYEPIAEEEDWLEEPAELPRRPRQRLLTPIPLALLGVLLIACGFIGGVLVEKGQSTSNSAGGGAGGLASRFAALRSGASGTGARSGASAAGGAGGFLGGGAGGGRTAGQVAYLAGSTLYLTNSEGNTVKVATSAGTTVTKTVSSAVKDIHPGETITVTGTSGKGGAVSAESISVGSSGAGLAALFGGSGSSGSASSAGSSGAASSSSGPALFGNGG